MTTPTCSNSPMRASLKRHADRVQYQRTPKERAEAVFARITGRRSLEAAKQAMLRAKRDAEAAVEAFVATDSMDRLTWFTEKMERLAALRPPLPLAEAVTRKAQLDGLEDGELVAYAQRLDDPTLARSELRMALRERSATDDLIAAICARHGFTL